MKTNIFRAIALFSLLLLLGPERGAAQVKKIFIVHITDEKARKPAPEVDIFSRDAGGNEIFHGKTNSRGDLEIRTDIKPGNKIWVKATKTGTYEPLALEFPVYENPSENRAELKMTTGPGEKVTVKAFNPKSRKPLEKAMVSYRDHVGDRVQAPTNAYGEASFLVFFDAGTDIEFSVEKPGYADLPVVFVKTIKKGGSDFLFEVGKQKKFSMCNCFLIGAGATAVAAGVLEGSSKKAYTGYKDFTNAGRESDYSKSNNRRRGAIIGGGVAVLSSIGYWLCHKKEKRKAQERKRRQGYGNAPPAEPQNGTLVAGPKPGN